MERLEGELRHSLERKAPSADFTGRVMGRVRAEPRSSRVRLARWGLAGAIAASMLAAVALQQRQARLDRERAEEARDQLVYSLQLAGSKFNKARQAVLNIGKGDSL